KRIINAKTPARRPAFLKAALVVEPLAAVRVAKVLAAVFLALAAIVETAVVEAVVKMLAALAADVMAVDPATPGPVTGNPDHLVVACPVARPVMVVRPVADTN